MNARERNRDTSPTKGGSAVLPICSRFKGHQRRSPLPVIPMTGFLPAYIYGGRYWDRTSHVSRCWNHWQLPTRKGSCYQSWQGPSPCHDLVIAS